MNNQNSGLHTFFKVLSFFLSIPLLAIMLYLFFRLSFYKVTSSAFGLVEEGKLSSVPIGSMVPEEVLEDAPLNENSTLADLVYEYLADTGEFENVSRRDVVGLLDDLKLEAFMDDIMDSYMDVLSGGSGYASISRNQMLQLIKTNIPVVERYLHIEVDEEAMREIYSYLEEMDIEEMTMVEAPRDAEGLKVFSTVGNFLFGDIRIPILGLLLVVLFIMLFNYYRLYAVLGYTGVCSIITAVLGLGIWGVLLIVKNSVHEMPEMAGVVLEGLGSIVLKNALLFLAAGIVMIIVRVVCGKICTKKQNAQNCI